MFFNRLVACSFQPDIFFNLRMRILLAVLIVSVVSVPCKPVSATANKRHNNRLDKVGFNVAAFLNTVPVCSPVVQARNVTVRENGAHKRATCSGSVPGGFQVSLTFQSNEPTPNLKGTFTLQYVYANPNNVVGDNGLPAALLVCGDATVTQALDNPGLMGTTWSFWYGDPTNQGAEATFPSTPLSSNPNTLTTNEWTSPRGRYYYNDRLYPTATSPELYWDFWGPLWTIPETTLCGGAAGVNAEFNFYNDGSNSLGTTYLATFFSSCPGLCSSYCFYTITAQDVAMNIDIIQSE